MVLFVVVAPASVHAITAIGQGARAQDIRADEVAQDLIPVAPPVRLIPLPMFPEMTLLARFTPLESRAVPPMVLSIVLVPDRTTPSKPFDRPLAPEALVPIKFPWTTLNSAPPVRVIPFPRLFVIVLPSPCVRPTDKVSQCCLHAHSVKVKTYEITIHHGSKLERLPSITTPSPKFSLIRLPAVA